MPLITRRSSTRGCRGLPRGRCGSIALQPIGPPVASGSACSKRSPPRVPSRKSSASTVRTSKPIADDDGRRNRDQTRLFYEFNLDEAVPDDYLVRKVSGGRSTLRGGRARPDRRNDHGRGGRGSGPGSTAALAGVEGEP